MGAPGSDPGGQALAAAFALLMSARTVGEVSAPRACHTRARSRSIREKVFFETGQATIKAQSFDLLTQIADVLKAHLEIRHLLIEGHTDSAGEARVNRALSLKRAQSVRDFLIKQDVAQSRLEARGIGPDRPFDDNTTAAGRENNRRVEFLIVAPDAENPVVP